MRLFLLTMTMAAALHAQSYPIHFAPPVHAGQSYRFTATGSKSAKASAAGSPVGAEEFQVSFEGTADVLEVDKRGRAVRLAFTVRKFSKTENGETREVLKPGDVILTDGDGDATARVDLKDGMMHAVTRDAFELIYSPHKRDDVSDDDVFAPKEPKSPGDSWPINVALAAEGLKRDGITVPEGHMSGTVSLTGLEKIGAADCLRLRGEFHADAFTPPHLPEGFEMAGGDMRASLTGCYPLNESALSYREAAEMGMHIVLRSKDVTVDSTVSMKMDAVWTALEK